MTKKQVAEKFSKYIEKLFPEAECALVHENPFQLLVATVLSAQCTDERVNIITKELFKRFPDAESLADAEISEIEEYIKTAGLFRNKAKSLKGLGEMIINDFSGKMPKVHDELVKLPGVGNKTANVVMGNCFGEPAITVDTHVKRISKRIGLTKLDDPDKIEIDLRKLIQKKDRTVWSHRTILFGRNVCIARAPKCDICEMADVCRYKNGK